MVFEMFGEKSKQYYTTLHYTVLNHTSLHYTTWPCTSLDCTVSCAHNRCGRPGRGEAGYWNTLPPLGTALDRRGLSQLDYLGHCPLAWHCPTGVHPPCYLELTPRRERCLRYNCKALHGNCKNLHGNCKVLEGNCNALHGLLLAVN